MTNPTPPKAPAPASPISQNAGTATIANSGVAGEKSATDLAKEKSDIENVAHVQPANAGLQPNTTGMMTSQSQAPSRIDPSQQGQQVPKNEKKLSGETVKFVTSIPRQNFIDAKGKKHHFVPNEDNTEGELELHTGDEYEADVIKQIRDAIRAGAGVIWEAKK